MYRRAVFGTCSQLVTALLLLLGSLTALAEPVNKNGVAVIVGNTDYQGRIPDVDFAGNDAGAFRQFVVEVLNFDPENIIDLRDATQADMQAAFGNERTVEGKLWRYLDPKGNSDIVVFYSGHGVPGLKDKRGYLLPVNADPEAPEINGYPLDTLLGNLAKLKARSITVFLDACFSGDSQNGMLIKSTSGITITPRIAEVTSSPMTVLTAAQGDQVASWDAKAKHGLFTKHLLDAMYGDADKSGYGNSDGKINLAEVKGYLDDKMTRAARRQYGRHQIAWIKGGAGVPLVDKIPGKRTPYVPAPPKAAAAPQVAAVQPTAPAVAPPKKTVSADGRWRGTFDTSCTTESFDFDIIDNKVSTGFFVRGYNFSLSGKVRPDGGISWNANGAVMIRMKGKLNPATGKGKAKFDASGECDGFVTFAKLK